ncbi:BON domain-containing protein [Flavobacterium sp.]|jgi:osmotically-inducible protein OsmY|uniref:BON domain-containing protein n=1 Tax=Flavobacterium sp. TaxID=239 RepID=UPI0037C0FAD8
MTSDILLQLKIIQALQKNGITSSINIEVKNLEVTLKGLVNSYDIKDKIEQIIVQFTEIQAVNNELAILNEH